MANLTGLALGLGSAVEGIGAGTKDVISLQSQLQKIRQAQEEARRQAEQYEQEQQFKREKFDFEKSQWPTREAALKAETAADESLAKNRQIDQMSLIDQAKQVAGQIGYENPSEEQIIDIAKALQFGAGLGFQDPNYLYTSARFMNQMRDTNTSPGLEFPGQGGSGGGGGTRDMLTEKLIVRKYLDAQSTVRTENTRIDRAKTKKAELTARLKSAKRSEREGIKTQIAAQDRIIVDATVRKNEANMIIEEIEGGRFSAPTKPTAKTSGEPEKKKKTAGSKSTKSESSSTEQKTQSTGGSRSGTQSSVFSNAGL